MVFGCITVINYGMRSTVPVFLWALSVGIVEVWGYASAASWLLLGTTATQQNRDELAVTSYQSRCRSLDYLGDRQKQLCIADRNVLKTVTLGASMGIEECQSQFSHKRWNCSVSNSSSDAFSPALTINSREKAYLHAVSAAGVAHAVTKACSQGEILDCGCDQRISSEKPNGRFQWGGCSDDISFGNRFCAEFVDSRENRLKPEGLMNLHNNEAGRRSVKSNMQVMCKCHGVSGSCSIQFCWRKLSNFRKIGDALGDKFEGAHHVRMNHKKKKLRPKRKEQKWPPAEDLVYLEKSPDYCEKNAKFGIDGTRGRRCNRTSQGADGCGILCCGRGYRTMIKEETKECRCKFVWCCSVKCEQCLERTEEYICN